VYKSCKSPALHEVLHDFLSKIIIYSSKNLAMPDFCVIFLVNTASDTAAAALMTVFYAQNQEKYGIQYGYSRINDRIFGPKPAKVRQK